MANEKEKIRQTGLTAVNNSFFLTAILLILQVIGWALFVGSDYGVSLPLLLQKLFTPSAGVSALYYLRNYGVLLAVCVFCCTSLTEKVYAFLKKHTLMRGIALGALFIVTIAYMVDATNSPFLYFRF